MYFDSGFPFLPNVVPLPGFGCLLCDFGFLGGVLFSPLDRPPHPTVCRPLGLLMPMLPFFFTSLIPFFLFFLADFFSFSASLRLLYGLVLAPW